MKILKKTKGAVEDVSGKGARIAIVVARFNQDISLKLLEGAQRILVQKGVKPKNISIFWVPGAFEIPLLSQHLARQKKYDGLITLGSVIRGETPHFDFVAGECSRGILDVSLKYHLPIAFGVLTTNNISQALARCGGAHGHKGEDMALVVLEMIQRLRG